MKKTLITADANCYFPSELFPDNVPVIQSEIKTDSGSFRESYEISSENILEYTVRKKAAPQLISPTVEQYRSFFEKELKQADTVCHLCCGSNIRDSYKNASEAAASMKNVFVADSKQVGGGMIFQLIQAIKLAEEGFSPEFIIRSIDELDKHINSTYVSADSNWLSYLGRISQELATFLELFELSPTITVRNGGIISGAVFRNGKDYYKMYIKKILKNKKNIDKSLLIISCPGIYNRNIDKYKNEVAKYVDFKQIAITDISTKFVCRLGENSLGLHFLTV